MANKSFTRMESICLEDEIDFLSAVFFQELQISNENTDKNEKILYLNLEPSTADDKTKQFVFVKLRVIIPIDYPNVSPIWSTLISRGLNDDILNNLLTEARQVSEGKIGHSMLYEVIEHLKVFITQQNKPSEACCVCMCEFDLDQEYTKTNCFHFFHLSCFSSYVQVELESIHCIETEDQISGLKKEKLNLECPVCREVITNDSQCLYDIKEINPLSFFDSRTELFTPNREMLEQQAKRKELYERQLAVGGIIDLKEEATKFDMDSYWRPPTPEINTELEPIEVLQTELVEDKPSKEGDLVFSVIQVTEPEKEITTESNQLPPETNNKQTTPKRYNPRHKQQQKEYYPNHKYYNRKERDGYNQRDYYDYNYYNDYREDYRESYGNYRWESNQSDYNYSYDYRQEPRQSYRNERDRYNQHDYNDYKQESRPKQHNSKSEKPHYQSRY